MQYHWGETAAKKESNHFKQGTFLSSEKAI